MPPFVIIMYRIKKRVGRATLTHLFEDESIVDIQVTLFLNY